MKSSIKKLLVTATIAFMPMLVHADKYAKGWGVEKADACDAAKDAAEDERRRTVNSPFRHRIEETGGCRCSRLSKQEIKENEDDDRWFCSYAYAANYY